MYQKYYAIISKNTLRGYIMNNIDEEIRIIPTDVKYLKSYNDTLNEVSLEGKYLSTNKGFALSSTEAFMKDCMANGFPAFIAVNEKDEAIGWCDIVPRSEYKDKLTGSIGVGLRKAYRGAGIGKLLISRTIQAAVAYGFERVVLEVRESNEHARYVYEQLGFEYDGDVMRDIDGESTAVKKMYLDLVEEDETGENVKPRKLPYILLVCGGCIIGTLIAILCIIH